MPIRIDFPDRNTRIHFERTVRKHYELNASISLPKSIRQVQSAFLSAMRARNPGKIVMVRPDVPSLSFVAFLKEDDEGGWTRHPEQYPIPRGIMLPGFTPPSRILSPMCHALIRTSPMRALCLWVPLCALNLSPNFICSKPSYSIPKNAGRPVLINYANNLTIVLVYHTACILIRPEHHNP
jgi:hypothetical protein